MTADHGPRPAPLLLVFRGLPGSGKTTLAREWVAADRGNRARVNRDDLRSMMDDGEFIRSVTEPRIVTARDALITGLLATGVSVACDDTNLPPWTIRFLFGLAAGAGALLEIRDLTNVPLETCIARNAARTGRACLDEAVIRGMHADHIQGRGYPLPWA